MHRHGHHNIPQAHRMADVIVVLREGERLEEMTRSPSLSSRANGSITSRQKGSIAVNGVIGDGGLANALKIVLEMNEPWNDWKKTRSCTSKVVHDVVVELVPLEVDVGLELEGSASVGKRDAFFFMCHVDGCAHALADGKYHAPEG